MMMSSIYPLLLKNKSILRRTPVQLLVSICLPLACVLLVIASTRRMGEPVVGRMFSTAHAIYENPTDVTNPQVYSLTTKPTRENRPKILFAPDDAYHSRIVHSLAFQLDLSIDLDTIGFSSIEDLAHYSVHQQLALKTDSKINYAIAFTTYDKRQHDDEVKGTHYVLWSLNQEFEDSVIPYLVENPDPLVFKQAIDRAIVQTRTDMVFPGTVVTPMNVSISHFPLPVPYTPQKQSSSHISDPIRKYRIQHLEISLTLALVILGFTPLMLILVNLVSSEIHSELIGNLRSLGTTETGYWLSNFITAAVLTQIATILMLLSKPVMPETFPISSWDTTVLYCVISITGMYLVTAGFLVTSVMRSAYSSTLMSGVLAMVCVMGPLMIGFLDNVITPDHARSVTAPNTYQSVFTSEVAGWILSWMFPFFPLGKLFTDMYAMTLIRDHGNEVMFAQPLSFAHPSLTLPKLMTLRTQSGIPVDFLVPSTHASFVFLVALILVQFLAIMYLDQVLSGIQSPLFLFSLKYWGLSKDRVSGELDYLSNVSQSLIVRHLNKSFKYSTMGLFKCRSVMAVKDVSFSVQRGHVLTVLGTNGAGKSTCIRMITGMIRPSSGHVSCFGYSNASQLRKHISVCPQSDQVWPLLTASEHVRLYASIRGAKVTPAYIQTQLSRVGLEGNSEQCVGEYSGGMKRRLCVMLTGIGSPSVCIMDEPTASLDPINRRLVWTYIQSLKKNAAVVLTTHLLDEADSLSDQICVMNEGNVRAVGSPLELKNKFGSGYEITMLTHDGVSLDALRIVVMRINPNAVVSQRSLDMFVCTVWRNDLVSPLIRYLQSNDPERVRLIKAWDITSASLEQAILNMESAVSDEFASLPDLHYDHDDERTTNQTTVVHNFNDFGTNLPKLKSSNMSFSRQLCAVVLKDWVFQFRHLKTTLFIYLISLVSLGVLVKMCQDVQEVICPGGHIAQYSRSSAGFSCDLSDSVNSFIAVSRQCSPGSEHLCMVGDTGFSPAYVGLGLNTGTRYWVNGDHGHHLFADDHPEINQLRSQLLAPEPAVFPRPTVRFVHEDAALLIQRNLKHMHDSSMPIPPQCQSSSHTQGQSRAFHVSPDQDLYTVFTNLLPDIGVNVNSGSDIHFIVPPPHFLAAEYVRAVQPIGTQECAQVILRGHIDTPRSLITSKNALNWQGWERSPNANVMKRVVAELAQAAHVSQLRSLIGSSTEGIYSDIQYPDTLHEPTFKPLFASLLVPLALYVLFSPYLAIPNSEKDLFEFYRVNGLSLVACWAGHYVFAVSLSIVPVIVSAVILALVINSVFIPCYLVVALITVHGSISAAFLVAAVVRHPLLARLVSLLFAPVATLASVVTVLSHKYSYGPSSVSVLFSPIPFAFNLRQLIVYGQVRWDLAFGSFFMSTVYLLLAVLILTCPQTHFATLYHSVFRARPNPTVSLDSKPAVTYSVDSTGDEDEGVRRERLALLQNDPAMDPQKLAVKAVNVKKSFGHHQVLTGVNLAIAPGVTFGLLGHNGCGKSTLLNILMGSLNATSGKAWVGGHRTNSGKVSSVLGVCPQHDMVLNELSVGENLRYFAQIRGADLYGHELCHIVDQCAEMVGLLDVIDRRACELSGGMGRRLALGISMIGSPSVVLIDEPSAGLDASNRLGVWKILSGIRDRGDASVVLTTHCMTEAEALCTRLGIMAKGKMRVVGHPVAVKQKYGAGYVLTMQIPVAMHRPISSAVVQPGAALAAETAAVDWTLTRLANHMSVGRLRVVHEYSDDLADQRAYSGTLDQTVNVWHWELKVRVPLPETCDLADTFEFLDSGEMRVSEYGIMQAALEDVFISVSSRDYEA